MSLYQWLFRESLISCHERNPPVELILKWKTSARESLKRKI